MKKLSALLSFLILFTAFTCENEPLEGEFGDETETTITCAEATQNTVTATTNFAGVSPDDVNYTQLCLAYTSALQDQIEACGDDGTIQAIIDSLGDCGDNNQTGECEAATIIASQTGTAYNNDTTNSDLCNTYKNALQNKISTCGDADGSIQTIIEGLGDCSNMQSSGTLSVTAGTLNIQFTTNSAELNSGLIIVNGSNLDNGANYLIYFEIPEGTTGVDVMQNFKLTLNGGEFFPNTDGFDDFTSTISVSSGNIVQGTFGGVVTRTDGADLSLSQGIVDLAY